MAEAPENARFLAAYLADHGAKCPNCRFELRGLKSPVCPECGDPLVLLLSDRAPKHATLGLTYGPLIYGLLFSIMWCVINLGFGSDFETNMPRAALAACGIAGFGAPILVVWARWRSLVRKPLPLLRRLKWAAWAWIGALAAALAVIARHV